MVDCCFLYSVESPVSPESSLDSFLCTCAFSLPSPFGSGCLLLLSWLSWSLSLCERLLIWKYFTLFPLVTYRCLYSPSQSQVFLYWFIYLFWHVPAFEAIAQMGCLPLSVDEMQRMVVWLEVEAKEEISCWEEIHDSRAHCLQLFLE